MTILTAEQVAGVVNSGGGPPTGSTTAQWVSVARRESGFNDSVEDFLHSGHWGLWQIGARTHFQKYGSQYGTVENFAAALKSPLVNWNVARRLFMDSGWTPWNASGGTPIASAADQSAATHADNAFGASGGGDPGEAVPEGVGPTLSNLNPIDNVADFLGQIIDPIRKGAEWIGDPHNWIRVVQVVGGVLLGIVAVTIVFRPVIESVPKGIL